MSSTLKSVPNTVTGNKKRLLSQSISLILGLSPLAGGMASAATLLEEVIVTAQKREQKLNDVGVAVTAFTGDQMKALGFESSTDLIAYTPGISLAGDIGGQRAIFNIRGVVQNDYADLAEAPVAVYVDGAYLASTQAQTFGLYDVARIEMLKGPQGTLFGRNATGGLVNSITNKPTDELEGYIEGTVASFSQIRLEGAISGPLGDSVRGRLAFMTNQQDEILDNIYPGVDFNGDGGTAGGEDGYNDDTVALRGHLEFDIGDEGSLLLSANWADTTKSEGPYQLAATTEIRRANGEVIDVIYSIDDPMNCDVIQAGVCIDGNGDGSVTRPVVGGDFFGNVNPDGTGDKVNKDFAFDDQNELESKGISAEFKYDFEWAQLTSLTDYKNFTRVIGLDSDQSATGALIFQSDGDTDQFSQEIRFNGTTDNMVWVAGGYYLSIDTDFIQGLAASPVSQDWFGIRGQEANTITELNTDSFSVFGQFDYSLSDELVLVAGLRLIQENKDFQGVVTFFPNTDDRKIETDNPLFDIDQLEDDNDQDLWSGKIQLEYSPDENSLYYAGINRGVKAGSFNAPLFGGFSPYDEEILLSYEVGAKLTLVGGSLQLNMAAYYYDYKDYQSFTFVNNSSSVTNEDATYTGFEVEMIASPTDAVEVLLGVSYVDAEVEDLQIASDIFINAAPPFTPEWQVSGLVRYTWDVFGGDLTAQLSANYQSEFFHNARNFTAHEFDSYTQAKARLSWSDAENSWNIATYVDNLTDEDNAVIGFDVSGFYGSSQESYARPRSYGLTVRRNF
ncbi:MAG: TonB-dependent receptor [Gammaproteobacteria bacterium]|nr:TonB-dependent receptor [Gammaproteobacteria bacterium]